MSDLGGGVLYGVHDGPDAMDVDPADCQWDCIKVPLGSHLREVDIPKLGSRGWAPLGQKQIDRIISRDHMVVYKSAFGASYPYKFCEEVLPEIGGAVHLLRYTRRGEHDLIVKRSTKANIATCLDLNHVANMYMGVYYKCCFSLSFFTWCTKCHAQVLRLESYASSKDVFPAAEHAWSAGGRLLLGLHRIPHGWIDD